MIKCQSTVAPKIVWSTVIRGTQREYSSLKLKHSIVKRILVFSYMVDTGIFLSCSDFLAESLSDPKIIGIKTYLFENFSQKKASENSS